MLKRSHITPINCIASVLLIISAVVFALDFGTDSPSTGLYSQHPSPPAQNMPPPTPAPVSTTIVVPAVTPVVTPVTTVVPTQNFTTSPMPAGMSGTVTVSPIDKQHATVKLVNNAITLVKQHGRDMAFAEFNRNPGIYSKGSAYVFAIDFNGSMLANGYNANLIGAHVLDLKNVDGIYMYQVLTEKAKGGGGWVQYRELNPDTNQIECRKNYIMPVEGTYYIGSGFYYPVNSNRGC
jgi:hypothetical protein